MVDEYFRRNLYTAAAENQQLMTELAIVSCLDANIGGKLDPVIKALQKTNALITKLAQSNRIELHQDCRKWKTPVLD